MVKRFATQPAEIKPLATGRGSCFASDRITIDGLLVGFMYRENSDNERDSGWRFLAGDEPDEYVSDPANFEIYDVNTVANYDPAIIRHLDAPVGSAYSRNPASWMLVAVNH